MNKDDRALALYLRRFATTSPTIAAVLAQAGLPVYQLDAVSDEDIVAAVLASLGEEIVAAVVTELPQPDVAAGSDLCAGGQPRQPTVSI